MSMSKKRSRSPSNVSDGSSDTSGSSAWSELDDQDTHWLSKAEQDKADASRRDRLHRQDGQRRGRSTTPERITSATPLNDTNVGMKMLRLMGWGGGGLGARGTGRVEPIPLPDKMDSLGLGKANIETRMLDDAVAKRPKVLESQRIANETEEQRTAREATIANKAERHSTIQETLAKFYCDICSKGYANVSQWEEHLLSYGHNHAKRKKEVAMQNKQAMNRKEDVDRRREKEKKREQKELERMVVAAGGKASQFSAAGSSTSTVPPKSSASLDTPISEASQQPSEKKKGGFFKVAGGSGSGVAKAPEPISGAQGGFHSAGSLPSHALPASTPPQSAPPVPSSLPPPPPPPSLKDYSDTSAAPRFISTSSLASTWKPSNVPTLHPSLASSGRSERVETIRNDGTKTNLANSWKPTSAPALHPLLGGQSAAESPSEAIDAQAGQAARERNDFFKQHERDARASKSYEAPTLASSLGVGKAPKGMQFVASAASKASPSKASQNIGTGLSMSLSGNALDKKKPLDMEEDDEEAELALQSGEAKAVLPTGRPKARMPVQAARGGKNIGFGRLG